MKKRLLITILILLLVTGCTVNDSSGLTVISKEIEVMSTSDYYLQDFDVSMMDKNNDLTYEIIVDKDIELSVTNVDGMLAFEVVNNTDKRLGIFDASMRLERLIDQEWIKVPFAEGVGFCGNASSFDENGHYGPIVFETLFESIESGEYRFSLIVSDDISIRDAKDQSRVYAAFVVSE